jgi:hypothetical protein
MLNFQRDTTRRRIRFLAQTQYGRYEVEPLWGGRWYVWLSNDGRAWPIGDREGYAAASEACVVAEAHWLALVREHREAVW